ncbi:sulfite exporter TauE/SafE family protein [Companilactobacillus mishanensis]|uniref:Probable membrane transporter protein n=1 Tax=Companilactobacillus mishanensis TaxID=2486008 RepID=A0ABW9P6F3_9LACO|nr:sulfite exporter TauE/SafE family protein [Companilactobacillus mishanensis]MQS44694.1 sulfite exporter TauE/SafE family protein [Companilactobacillus mishanensis]
MTYVSLILIGFAIGLFVLSTGGGGAALYIGVLTTFFHLSAPVAAATSLFTAFPSLCVGAYGHYRTGNIRFKIGNKMLISAIPAAIVGALVSPYIPMKIYTWIVAIILTVLGIQILYSRFFSNKKADAKTAHANLKTALFGILAGLMVGIAGLSGGGPVIAGLLVMNLDMIRAAATSSYILVGTTGVGLLFHLSTGNIDWKIGVCLMIGAIVGGLVAPKMLAKMDPVKFNNYVKPFIGILLVVMGLHMVI